MQYWIATISGIALTLAGAGETFMAVLYPRAINGPITAALNRLFHELLKVRWIAGCRFVVAAGPMLVVMQVLGWATLLLLGISLIVWPQLSTGITATGSNPTDTDFASAVYYAGFTITTLGVGDLVPRTPAMQVLTITAAGLGFSFFTLVLAYVISVYSTLARRNQFANEIEYRTGRTGESVKYLRAYLSDADPSLINQDLYALSSNMAELLESHHFYPVLHYFRFREPRYAMSRMLRFCLEVASMMRTPKRILKSFREAFMKRRGRASKEHQRRDSLCGSRLKALGTVRHEPSLHQRCCSVVYCFCSNRGAFGVLAGRPSGITRREALPSCVLPTAAGRARLL